MKPYNAPDFKVGDTVAVYANYRNHLPIKQIVTATNTKFFTTNNGSRFSHSTWEAWGSKDSMYSGRCEPWNEDAYQAAVVRVNKERRRIDLLRRAKSIDFNMIRDDDVLEHLITLCEDEIGKLHHEG